MNGTVISYSIFSHIKRLRSIWKKKTRTFVQTLKSNKLTRVALTMMCFLIQNMFNNRFVLGWENANTQFEKYSKCKQRYQHNPSNTNAYGCHFADDILKCISLNEIYLFSNKTPKKHFAYAPRWQYTNIGSGNVLATSKRQDIIWTHERLF